VIWHYIRDGQQGGPVGDDELRAMLAQGRLGLQDLVWREGMAGWAPAGSALGIAAPPPPPALPPSAPVGAPYPPLTPQWTQGGWVEPPKSRAAYVVLGLFVGTLGIHNFYAGYTSRGIAQLLITLLGFWLVVPLLAVMIWNIVEVITVDRDSSGRFLS
jgi:uncharacterized protein DUF4339/TM2 domain-containing protein